MEGYDLYYGSIYLGSLYENGEFEYHIDSKYGDRINVEDVAHDLELIRTTVKKEEGFNLQDYVEQFNNFRFNNIYKFVKQL